MDYSEGQGFVMLDENDIGDYNEEGILPQSPEILAQIQKWLQPTDYLADSSEYNKHLNSHVPGTSLWLQQTEAYRIWHDSSDHGALWMKAIAGAGKSVFAAVIAAQLEQEKVPVLTFFFRQIIATNHDPQSLARDWISMSLKHSPPLQARMKKYIDAGRVLHDISLAEFWQDLGQALESLPKVYCIVDALDEMDIDKESFFKDLVTLGQRNSSTIKLLMTSRPLPRIESYFKDTSILQVRLEQMKVDKDIVLFLNHRLASSQTNFSTQSAVKQGIGQKANGSFLYARLMTDELLVRLNNTTPDPDSVQRSLDSLPVSLEDMYIEMLHDHSIRSRVSQDLQLIILGWVCHSTRPLRLLELATILDSQSQLGKDRKETKALVRTACGPLLEILEDETVSIIHHSFTEFLIDFGRKARTKSIPSQAQFPVLDSLEAHRLIALACIKYITSGCLDTWRLCKGQIDRQKSQLSLKISHPFIAYALSNWHVHVQKSGPLQEVLLAKVDEFMQLDRVYYQAWLDFDLTQTQDLSRFSTLHAATWAGMAIYAKHLLDRGHDSNVHDTQQRTPLSWAAAKGHTACVALLLETADPDADDLTGLKPLHYAAMANHFEIVKLLINAGVSPLTRVTRERGFRCSHMGSRIGDTPLKYASQSGSTEAVQIMIPHLAAKDLEDACLWAAARGRAAIIDMVLEFPLVSPEPVEHQDTPLFLASQGLNYHIMDALLKKGADPNKRSAGAGNRDMQRASIQQSKYGPTPLHAVCLVQGRGHTTHIDVGNATNCLRLLLDAGADVHMVEKTGRTPMHHAVSDYLSQSRGSLIKLLLDNGANSNAQDNSGNAPLHLVNLGSKDAALLIDLLVSRGAKFEIRNKQGRTPLHVMCDNSSELDINILRPRVSDWNCRDSVGDTPLHIVLSKSDNPTAALKFLLAAGADLNIKNRAGEAPIHVIGNSRTSTSYPMKSTLSMLLSAGSSLETRDNKGRTFLLRKFASSVPSLHVLLKILLDLGSNVDARDYSGNCILHLACKKDQSIDLIQALVAAGANPLSTNHAGDTLLHEVFTVYATGGSVYILQLIKPLLDLGVPAGARNNCGQTPLHAAMQRRPPNQCVRIDYTRFLDDILRTEVSKSLDAEDNDGIRPIHLAAAFSETLVSKLIDRGADATSVTNAKLSVLHIASRAKQSNTIGRLLEHFVRLERFDMLHLQDKIGWSALHYACRSGRPESVALLLAAGADPNIQDNNNRWPLHACAEFESYEIQEGIGYEQPDALRISDEEIFKQNYRGIDRDLPIWNWNSTNAASTRIREIICLLLKYGSKISVVDEPIQGRYILPSPLDTAISLGCAEMVDELSSHVAQDYAVNPAEAEDALCPAPSTQSFQQRYLIKTTRLNIVKEDLPKDGNIASFCHDLLSLRQHKAIEQLPALMVDFSPQWASHSKKDFMKTLAQHGYVTLFEKLGASIRRPGWVDGLARSTNGARDAVLPYLTTAASRELPNLDIIKLIVEKFDADINAQPIVKVQKPHQKVRYVPGDSALHILARGDHWWQTDAVKYLLSRGANPELRNEQGQTVINVTNQGDNPYRWRHIVKILLEHGANPNSMDITGSTRLSSSMDDVELLRLLINHGADISLVGQSALRSAINSQDLETIKILIEAGALNVTANRVQETKFEVQRQCGQYQESELHPLHYAAIAKFNTPKLRDSALLIVRLLLENGADPYSQYEDSTIINDIFRTGGIIQPFLDYPGLDLEVFDSKGQTLLLAACQSSFGSTKPTTVSHPYLQSAEEELKYTKGDPCRSLVVHEMGGDLMAVDHEGNNALHLLLQASTHDNDEFEKTFRIFLNKAPGLVLAKNAAGNTPFHAAISNINSRIWAAELLMAAGADPLEKDGLGNTVLHYIIPQLCTSVETDE